MDGLKEWLARLNTAQKVVLGAGLAFAVVLSTITARLISGPIAGRLAGDDRAVYTGPTVASPPPGGITAPTPGPGDVAPPDDGGSAASTGTGSTTGPPDLYLATVRVTGSGASTQGTSTAATSGGGGAVPAAPNEVRVGAVSAVQVYVQVTNGGGPSALGSTLEITLFTPGAPGGRRVAQSVAPFTGGQSGDLTATFDGLGAYAGRRLTVRTTLLPGDGGRQDYSQLVVVLAD